MRVKFDPNFEYHVNEFGVTSHEIQAEDIIINGLPKESDVNEKLHFKVCLSKEISEKGYVVTSDLVVQLTHTTSNAKTVCNVHKVDLNTWDVSCIPKAAGKYITWVTLDHLEATPLTLEVTPHRSYCHQPEPKRQWSQVLLHGKPDLEARVHSQPPLEWGYLRAESESESEPESELEPELELAPQPEPEPKIEPESESEPESEPHGKYNWQNNSHMKTQKWQHHGHSKKKNRGHNNKHNQKNPGHSKKYNRYR